MDRTCVEAGGGAAAAHGPCRSGLPFYRLRLMEGQTYLDCFTFCLSKGLDLSGVMALPQEGHQECRCGASIENEAAWAGELQQRGSAKQLPAAALPPGDDHCELNVWKYTGSLENKGVPFPLLQMSVDDEAYIDSIAAGHNINAEEDGDDVDADDAAEQAQTNISRLGLVDQQGSQ